jgi:hypothetical protein
LEIGELGKRGLGEGGAIRSVCGGVCRVQTDVEWAVEGIDSNISGCEETNHNSDPEEKLTLSSNEADRKNRLSKVPTRLEKEKYLRFDSV